MYMLSGIRLGFICFFFFQAEDGIRDLVRSRGLGDVYKRQLDHADLLSADFAQDLFGTSAHPVRKELAENEEHLSLIHI